MSQKVVYIIFFKKQPDVQNEWIDYNQSHIFFDQIVWIISQKLLLYIYFSFFSVSGKKYVASVKCTKSKCSRLLWQDQMLKRIKLTMNRTQLSYLLHFWIILIEPIFLFYAHIWIKYLCTANITHSYTNVLSTNCFENLDV